MARKITTKGFSLIELMVVVAIVVIVAVIAIPEYRSVRTANRVHQDINEMAIFIKEARLWAFTHKQRVTVSLDNSGDTSIVSATWDNSGTATNIYTPPELHYTYTGTSAIMTSGLDITVRGTYDVTAAVHFRLDEAELTNPSEREDCVQIDNIRARIGKYDTTTTTCIAY